MDTFEKSTESLARRSVEGQELSVETKEKQIEAQEKKMAAKERAESLSKEVKTTKKQIQNILANMQVVIKAVRAIRAQLQLTDDDKIPAVERDRTTIEQLKKKLVGLRTELSDLREALLIEEIAELSDNGAVAVTDEIRAKAGKRVNDWLQKLGA